MRRAVVLAAGLVLTMACLVACSGAGPGRGGPGIAADARPERARILRVVDGDTVVVELESGSTARVRLLGIDTPEVFDGVECGGRAASRAAVQLLPTGTRVVLVPDPTQAPVDRYDRILRYVMRGTLDINRVLVRQGNATVYVYDRKPFQRTKGYFAAQATAKAHHRGIWGSCP